MCFNKQDKIEIADFDNPWLLNQEPSYLQQGPKH